MWKIFTYGERWQNLIDETRVYYKRHIKRKGISPGSEEKKKRKEIVGIPHKVE